ncbi:hypothetical protein [Desulfovibrio gilichinskyi]|uniref:hypothetical protein n=1 Tax=Desulfovibrio gilichinskyi TaxID=1519643 RepID=UPI000A155AED
MLFQTRIQFKLIAKDSLFRVAFFRMVLVTGKTRPTKTRLAASAKVLHGYPELLSIESSKSK